MKDFIRKFLGLPSTEQIQKLNDELFMMQGKFEDAVTGMIQVREDMSQLRQDMRSLYQEQSSEIARIHNDVKRVKPVLKVEDPEAVKFIKGILSKYDRNLNTQQSFLETKMIELSRAEGQANKAISIATEAANKIDNVINGLGLKDEKPSEEIFEAFRYIIKEAAKAGPLQVE